MPTEFRPAVAEDIPTLVDIECRAFGRDGVEAREGKRRELEHELADYMVLIANGELVATARLLRHWLYVGQSRVLKGDVGHVAVAPEAQGRGHGTTLMQQIIPYMREQGFHLSRLGGLMRFYSRFGYEPFLRRYVQIPVPSLEAELKGCCWRDLLMLPDELAACVQFYDPSRHAAGVHDLRLRFGRGRAGQHALDETPPVPTDRGPDLKALDWVYEVAGEVQGFLRGGYGLVNAGDPAPSYRLDDFAYDYDCPDAVEALVKTLVWRAAHEAPTVISCRLPYDERLFVALTQAGIAFEVVEMRQAHEGNMMRVVDLPGTLQAVAPELTARLQAAGTVLGEGSVRFVLPEEAACVTVRRETVTCTDSGEAVELQCTQADFTKLLLGIVGFGEMPHLTGQLTASWARTLGLLFPRLPCASGPWG